MKIRCLAGVVLTVSLAASGASAQKVLGELRPMDMGGHALFGTGLALQGDEALVGAPGQNARGACSGAVHVLRATGAGWEEELLLLATDTVSGDRFGTSCALDGQRALVGAPGRDGGGGAYVFRREGSDWAQEAFLPPLEGGVQGFGVAVALRGDTALVLDENHFEDEATAAYVYRWDGAAWLPEAKLPIPLSLQPFEPAAAMVEDTIFMVSGEIYVGKRVYVFARDDHETPSILDDTWVLQSEIHPPSTYGRAALAADGGRLAVGGPQTPPAPYAGAVSIYERGDSGTPEEPLDDLWSLAAKLASPAHPPALDGFGTSVALEGDVLVVTSPLEPGPIPGGPSFGAVDVMRFDGASWKPEAHLAGPAATDGFGYSCALSGGRALVGDSKADDHGPETGSISALEHAASSWFLRAHLLPAGLRRVGCFGYAVDASGGAAETIVVGAQLTDLEAGVAYAFEAEPEGWLQAAQIVPLDPAPGDRFGSAVALDGDRLIVGAHQRDEAVTDQGAAYVFSRSGEDWTEEAVLVAAEPRPSAYFGSAVALWGDIALVGAHGDGALGVQAGAAYVFRRLGATWALEAVLHAPDAAPGAAFGKAVALEGGRALVGAPGAELSAGACYVFRDLGGTWQLEERLAAADAQPGDRFGFSCALSGDRALVGAWRADSGLLDEDDGAAYVFARDPLAGTWLEEQKLVPPGPSPFFNGWYGASVALEGARALCAMPTKCVGTNGDTKVFRLERSEKVGGKWIDVEQLDVDLTTLPWQLLGLDVDLDGPVAVIGAPALTGPEPHDFDFAGAVLLFPSEAPPLVGTPVSVSESAGGTQILLLDAPESEAGLAFLVMGSLSGTEPGVVLGPWTLPLNPDAYFMLVLDEPDQAPAAGFFGVLDGSGDAQAGVILAPGLATPLGYSIAHHAFAVLDFAAGAITFVSNPAPLHLGP